MLDISIVPEGPDFEELGLEIARSIVADGEDALQSAEELVAVLVCGEGVERVPVPERQDQLGAIPELRGAISHLLLHGSDTGRYYGCLALSYLLHCNPTNIGAFGRTSGIFEGIRVALSHTDCQGLACGVLSQLAFGNSTNGVRICEIPELFDLLADIVKNGRPMDQQAATCALSNCAANSPELALRIIAVPNLLECITDLCGPPSAGELLRDSRTGVSAIGCIDNLSFHEDVRPHLQKGKIFSVLRPIMELQQGKSWGDSGRVMSAESTMIVARLTKVEDLANLRVSRDVLCTIMHCLRCAIDGEHWASFAWRLGEMLEPIRRLSENQHNCQILAAEGACKYLVKILQMPESTDAMTPSGCAPATARPDCIHALANLAALPACLAALIGLRLHVPNRKRRHGVQNWETAASALEKSSRDPGCGGGELRMGSSLWLLRERHLAAMMALHQRLGADSVLGCLDNHLVRDIVESTSTATVAARELATYLRRAAGDGGIHVSSSAAWGEGRVGIRPRKCQVKGFGALTAGGGEAGDNGEISLQAESCEV